MDGRLVREMPAARACVRAGWLARSADGERHGDHRAALGVGGHLLPHSQTDLGVDLEAAFLGLDVLLECRACLAQTPECLLGLAQFGFQHANGVTQLVNLLLQSAQHTRTHTRQRE